MTKHLTKPIWAIHFLVLAFLMTIGTHVSAAETIMICDADEGEKQYYKHIKPLVGELTVKQKLYGKWTEWPVGSENDYQPPKVDIYNSGAMAVMYASRKLDNNSNEVLGLPKSTPLRKITTLTLDFEFGVRTYETSLSYLNSGGNYTTNQKLKEYQNKNKYSCEIIE
jgi:hypothetical protein